jgi:hypothetical protein
MVIVVPSCVEKTRRSPDFTRISGRPWSFFRCNVVSPVANRRRISMARLSHRSAATSSQKEGARHIDERLLDLVNWP